MTIKAEWYRPEVQQIAVRWLAPSKGFNIDSLYWKGVDAEGREVRLAVGGHGVAFGVGSHPDYGLLGTITTPDDAPMDVTLEAAKAAIREAGWPITWPEED
jgi:hypothetical protein